jgi:WD40 repeat protein
MIQVGAFAPDGKSLITCEHKQSNRPPERVYLIKHWEVGTGRELSEVTIEKVGHLSPSEDTPALSPDGSLLLTGDGKSKLVMRDTTTGKTAFEVPHQPAFGTPFAFSADKKIFAMGGHDGLVYVFDLQKGEELNRFKREEDGTENHGYHWPSLSPDGKTLVASTQTSIRIWDLTTGKLKREFEGCRGHVAFSSDGDYMACGDSKGICLIKVDPLREVRRFEAHGQFVLSLAFSRDGKKIVSALNHNIALWDVATGKRMNPIPGHEGVVYSLAFSPDGKLLASGGDDGKAFIWDPGTAKVRHELKGHYFATASLAFTPNGKALATGDGPTYFSNNYEAQIRLWDVQNGALLQHFYGHLGGVRFLAFSSNGKSLLSGGNDARARVWNMSDTTRLFQIRGGEGRRSGGFTANDEAVVIGNMDGELALWNAKTGKKIREFSSAEERRTVIHAQVLQDGKLASIESIESWRDRFRDHSVRLRIWDLESGKEERSFSVPEPYSFNGSPGCAISADGATAVIVKHDDRNPPIEIWDCATGNHLTNLTGHVNGISALVLSPDGKTLASGSADTTILLWRISGIRLLGAWRSLSGDKEEAARAAKAMMADPEETVLFLRDRLQTAAKLESAYARTILDLGNDDFDIREKASGKLEAAGAEAEVALRLALEARPAVEAQRRIEAILQKITGERDQTVLRLVADLGIKDGPEFDEAKAGAAFRKLRFMGISAERGLRQALEEANPVNPKGPPRRPRPYPDSPRARQAMGQVQRLLEELKLLSNDTSIDPNAASSLRSLAILADIGTPSCRAILEDLAKGEGTLSTEAKALLGRQRKP